MSEVIIESPDNILTFWTGAVNFYICLVGWKEGKFNYCEDVHHVHHVHAYSTCQAVLL